MTVQGLVSLVAGVLGIAGLIGTALAVLISARSRGTIEVLEKDNSALRARMDTLEEIEDECQKRLDHLEQVNRTLTETVTSAAKVDALGITLTGYHQDLIRRLELLQGRTA